MAATGGDPNLPHAPPPEVQHRLDVLDHQQAEMLKRRQWLFSAFVVGASIILSSTVIAGAIGGAQSSIPWCVSTNTTESDTGAIVEKAAQKVPGVARDSGMGSDPECKIGGFVYNTDFKPLSDARVTMPDGKTTVITDDTGFFTHVQCFNDTLIGLKVSKAGYIEKTFYGSYAQGVTSDFIIRLTPA